MLLIVTVASELAYAADCQPLTSEALNATMEEALLGFATMDDEGFVAASDGVRGGLPCLTDVLPPARAAAFHRMDGIRHFYDGDSTAATLSFRAAQAIEPGYALSQKIAPEGGKLARAWEGALLVSAAGQPTSPMAVTAGYQAWVDGVQSSSVPQEIPAVVQFGRGSRVEWTGLLAPGARLPAAYTGGTALSALLVEPETPEELAGPPGEPRPPKEPKPPKAPKAPRERGESARVNPMSILAVTSAVIAGGSFGASAYARGEFDRDPTHGLYLLNHGGYFGAIGFGLAAATFTGLAIAGGGR